MKNKHNIEQTLVNVEADRYVVNAETGEILDKIYPNQGLKTYDVQRLIDKKEYLENHILKFNEGENFVKLYTDVVMMLKEYLTPSEMNFIIYITPYISYEDCILRRTGRGNSKILTAKDISELLNMDYSVVRRIISSLKKKGVIGVHETGSILSYDENVKISKVITVNPYIFFKGVNLSKTILSFYDNSGWKELRYKYAVKMCDRLEK